MGSVFSVDLSPLKSFTHLRQLHIESAYPLLNYIAIADLPSLEDIALVDCRSKWVDEASEKLGVARHGTPHVQLSDGRVEHIDRYGATLNTEGLLERSAK